MASDSADLIRTLARMQVVQEPATRQAMDALRLNPGARGLDVGCGIGLQAQLLRASTRPGSLIVGLDISTAALAYARQLVATSFSPDGVCFTTGDMQCLPLADDAFDLVWSCDCVGYPASRLLPLLHEIVRVCRPGAVVAILGYTSQVLLPGYSMLEARLNAPSAAYASFLAEQDPESHFLRAGRWFPEAGISDVQCRTFLGEVRAPVTPAQRDAMLLLFEMLWGAAQSSLPDADRLAYDRLCRGDSPACILDLPDYYGLFTYTMFDGVVRK